MKPADFPVGKWYVDGEPSLWGLPGNSWIWIINVEYYKSNVSGYWIKHITASGSADDIQQLTRTITNTGDTGWKKLFN